MTNRSLAQPRTPNTRETREQRALKLYRERRRDIVLIAPDTYEVPSCTGRGVYTVRYGGDVESCNCPDARRHPELSCKHVLAVAICHAVRRGTTARRLAALEERLRNELMDAEERLELRERILRVRRRAGL